MIHVYQNVFYNIDDIFNFVKSTEEYKENTGMLETWQEWAGFWKGGALKTESRKLSNNPTEEQKKYIGEIVDAFLKVSKDYLNDYKNNDAWPDFIEDWSNLDQHPWRNDTYIDFLKYNKNQPEHLADSLIAMNYHTDFDNFDKESADNKKVITVTIYLNDNYEGGEISVYSPETEKIYNYKPKAGDIVVFPSGMNYYHGVLSFYGNDRYLVRMFKTYEYAGSEEWLKNKQFYGEDVWESMEKKRLQHAWENGYNLVKMVFSDKSLGNLNLNEIQIKEDPIYIDGTKNDN